MGRRKGEITSAAIDRDFPFQVALAADQVSGKSFELIQIACVALSCAPRNHSVRRDDRQYIVFCFATEIDAHGFKTMFGGEDFNPKERGCGRFWFQWRSKRNQNRR